MMSGEQMAQKPVANGSSSQPCSVAFLGPTGTYGHRAATCFIRYLKLNKAQLKPCRTMREAYESTDARYVVLPIENTIHGVVRETLDCLLSGLSTKVQHSAAAPQPLQIIADLVMPVRHALVAMKSSKLENIRSIRSHEQALGQCARWLNARVPNAKREPWTSTAAAAASILREEDAQVARHIAAICSPSADTLENGLLKVLAHDIQDYPDNFTRFLLLSRGPAAAPSDSAAEDPLALQPQRKFYALSDWSILNTIIAHHSTISSIHTRPKEIVHPGSSDQTSPNGLNSDRKAPVRLSRDQTGCWQWALIEVEAQDEATEVKGAIFLGTLDKRITSQEVIDAEYDASQALETLA